MKGIYRMPDGVRKLDALLPEHALHYDVVVLGGMATSGMVGPFMTVYDREGNRPVVGGIYREIAEKLHARGAILD